MNLETSLRALGDGGGAPPSVDEAAAVAGLVDVAYRELDSPLGPLLLAATERGLVTIAYDPDDATLARLARLVSPRVLRAPRRLDPASYELDEYFAGRRRDFTVPVDLQLAQGFGRRVLEATARIPFGRTASYADVAARAGSPRGSRAAGNALGANPIPIVVPCHRILRSGGALGGYTGGLDRKRRLLAIEDISVDNPAARA
jgi:methylated-DNA-[protein]-cysteine S-methyltransferase